MVFAQSADVVTSILDAEEVTYGQICYISAVHQNFVEDDASFEQAMKALVSTGQISENIAADKAVTMAELSAIYLQMWPEVKGGLMYTITKGAPRYAFKKLKSDGILSEKTDPSKKVSGADAMNILTSCMIEYGTSDEGMDMEWEVE